MYIPILNLIVFKYVSAQKCSKSNIIKIMYLYSMKTIVQIMVSCNLPVAWETRKYTLHMCRSLLAPGKGAMKTLARGIVQQDGTRETHSIPRS